MSKLKILFMGTPDFSVNVLKGLIENYDVIGVVTQPDINIGIRCMICAVKVKHK